MRKLPPLSAIVLARKPRICVHAAVVTGELIAGRHIPDGVLIHRLPEGVGVALGEGIKGPAYDLVIPLTMIHRYQWRRSEPPGLEDALPLLGVIRGCHDGPSTDRGSKTMLREM